jgi:glycosyltransferase involved in cell wall biosynthesis
VSEGYLDWGLKCAGRERSTWDRVFHIGYSDQGHGPGASRSQRLAELESKLGGKVVFTYIGSFGQSYELELVCEVARRALRIDMAPELHFLIVGDGESMKQIAGMASELSNITLTGWLDGDELRGVMRLSSVGLLPYRSVAHTLPNKAFEYLSAGLPVISSLEGEMVNIIAEADIGASYSCGDVAGLCAAVVRLGTDSELRARQSANARRVFAERFRAEDIYRSYANYIEMMIQMSRRGQGMSGSPSPADGSL